MILLQDIFNIPKIEAKNIFEIAVIVICAFFVLRTFKKGIALNILIGLIILNIIYLIAFLLKLNLLKFLLEKILSVGIIGMIIVFQPEIRRFLLNVGKLSPFGEQGFLTKFIKPNRSISINQEAQIEQIGKAVKYFIHNKLGALVVFTKEKIDMIDLKDSVIIDGEISCRLLESIFEKNSPLHDGAVIISDGKVLACRTVLPLSDNEALPRRIGLRHRAAVGASEQFNAFILIISEERQTIGCAYRGELTQNISFDEMKEKLVDFI